MPIRTRPITQSVSSSRRREFETTIMRDYERKRRATAPAMAASPSNATIGIELAVCGISFVSVVVSVDDEIIGVSVVVSVVVVVVEVVDSVTIGAGGVYVYVS